MKQKQISSARHNIIKPENYENILKENEPKQHYNPIDEIRQSKNNIQLNNKRNQNFYLNSNNNIQLNNQNNAIDGKNRPWNNFQENSQKPENNNINKHKNIYRNKSQENHQNINMNQENNIFSDNNQQNDINQQNNNYKKCQFNNNNQQNNEIQQNNFFENHKLNNNQQNNFFENNQFNNNNQLNYLNQKLEIGSNQFINNQPNCFGGQCDIYRNNVENNEFINSMPNNLNNNNNSNNEFINFQNNNFGLNDINQSINQNQVVNDYNQNNLKLQNGNNNIFDNNKYNKETTPSKQKNENNSKIKNNIELDYPHSTILKNDGNTSYMNASIQCLSNIKALTNYLLKGRGNSDEYTMPLTVEYSKLIFDLFNSREKFIFLKGFNEKIKNLNFKKEGSPKDFIAFLLENIGKELNYNNSTSDKDQNIILKKDFNQKEIDSRNENTMYTNFIKDFNNNLRNKIFDIFYGINMLTVECNSCKIKKYSFELFNILSFNLQKIEENKKKVLGIHYDKTLKLEEAIIYQKETNGGSYFCNNCG